MPGGAWEERTYVPATTAGALEQCRARGARVGEAELGGRKGERVVMRARDRWERSMMVGGSGRLGCGDGDIGVR